MTCDLTKAAEEISTKTDRSTEKILAELEKLTDLGSSLTAAKETVSARSINVPETRPWDLAAVGIVRGHMLYQGGYETVEAIADASTDEISRLDQITEPTATCIIEVAKNRLSRSGTMAAEVAIELRCSQSAIAEGYEEMAPRVITPQDAKPTLLEAFDDPVKTSIYTLDVSLGTLHHLSQAGYESLSEIADAPVGELETLPYIGSTKAEQLRQKALTSLEMAKDTENDPSENHEEPREHEERSLSEQDSTSKNPVASTGTELESMASTADPVDVEGFPEELVARDQWLLWKQTDDGRKIPRAPWATGKALHYVSAQDPENWTSFHEAKQWQAKLPHDLGLAYSLTREDGIVFLDMDDVITDHELSQAARDLIVEAASYSAVSTSGTGIHILLRGRLSEEVKSLTGPLGKSGEQTLEVYDRNRFVAMTGNHIESTPSNLSANESLLSRLEDEFAAIGGKTPDRAVTEPNRSRSELREMDTTSDIQDIFDAISQTKPSDIRMRSTQTREHGDGTYSYDPSWVYSESGTRLGVLDDVWIYRKGMIALDALQLVALEEGILTDENEYPEGEDFWAAVEALRSRGGHIPRYEPDNNPVSREKSEESEEEIDKWEVAKRINHGERVRTYVHPYDQDYMEKLALDLAPKLTDCAKALALSVAVTYRAAELYAQAHAAGIVPGAAHEDTLGAAVRIASIEANSPRPLDHISEVLSIDPGSVRQKFQRLITETDVSQTIDASDLMIRPVEYVPYMARQLSRDSDISLQDAVRDLLAEYDRKGATNPISDVAAAFYVVMKEKPDYSATQRDIANAANLSEVTIRNNYRKFTQD